MIIEIPILLRDIERRMRAGKGDNTEKRFGPVLSGKIKNLAMGLEFDIVIVILLHRANTGASLDNAVQRSSRGNKSRSRRPVGNPLIVCRIYICRQTLLKPMQLVGTNEMHFSRQKGLIAERPHEMRHCGKGGGDFISVVIHPDFGAVSTGQHRSAAWNA